MNVGMMWFDNDPKTSLSLKVEQAAAYYHRKYGQNPDLCLVNPGALNTAPVSTDAVHAGNIVIRPFRSVMPGHLWIGKEDLRPVAAA